MPTAWMQWAQLVLTNCPPHPLSFFSVFYHLTFFFFVEQSLFSLFLIVKVKPTSLMILNCDFSVGVCNVWSSCVWLKTLNYILLVAGIGRTFTYGGSRNNAMHDPAVHPRLGLTKEEYTRSTMKQTTINHFHEKLLKLKDLMKTEVLSPSCPFCFCSFGYLGNCQFAHWGVFFY